MKFSSAMRVASLLWLTAALGCSTGHDVDAFATAIDAGSDAGLHEDALDPQCVQEIADSTDGLPEHLRCAGLYADFAQKTLAKGVRPYTPGLVLWSDGAEKHRFIRLPPGEKIDASKRGDWSFPIGTQLFKEFKLGDRRIETRLFQKVRSDRWVRTAYRWNVVETDAVRFGGGDIDIGAGTIYHVPTGRECDMCHKGRRDRILGFEAIGLGVDAAKGLTLEKLVAQELIAPAPTRTTMQISDDGTGKAPEIIGWLHMNCGVTCHNENPDATGYSTRLRLRLSPDELDGRSANQFMAVKNLVNVDASTVRWKGQKRIVPGSPEDSLLFKLVGSRAGKNAQMPPIATRVVDQQHLQMLREWIASMPPIVETDAGTDAGADAGDDAGAEADAGH